MTNHPPIPPDYVRVVVHLGEFVHRMDVPADQINECVADFEGSFALPLHEYRHLLRGDVAVREIALDAAGCGYNLIVCQAALWLLLHTSERDRVQEKRDELWKLIVQDGGALITATCDGFSRGWAFEVSPTVFTSSGDAAFPPSAVPTGATLQ